MRRVVFYVFALLATLTVLLGLASMWFIIGFGSSNCLVCGTLNLDLRGRPTTAFSIQRIQSAFPFLRPTGSRDPCGSRLDRAFSAPKWISNPPVAVVPLWPLALLFAIAALLMRPRRTPAGCCRGCGYDLRGTPGRCPECGAVRVAGVERA